MRGEYGQYQAFSVHPGVEPSQTPVTWKVLGMRVTDQTILIQDETLGNIDKTYQNITMLVNDGPGTLTNIQVVSILNVPQSIELQLLFANEAMIPELQQGTDILVNLRVKATMAFGSIRAYVTLRSAEGVSVILILNVQISLSKPHLQTHPNRIEVLLNRGSQQVVNVNITNIGFAPATEVYADIPNVIYISVIQFGNSSYPTDKQDIAKGQSLSLLLQLTAPVDSELGRYSGWFTLYSNEIYSTVPFDIKIISDQKATVSFRVEDEFTYFAENNPLVDNARVRIYNSLRGINMVNTTEAGKGIVTFTDVPEETYEVNVDAPQHQGVQAVFKFNRGPSSFRIFLKRTAVTFRWTVRPTKIKDVYKVTVEADFQTRVPMPVVTVSPSSLELEPFELGLLDSFQLNFTNHGLIRADRFGFVFPTNHPTLDFVIVARFEKLEARTSKILPVRVVQKTGGSEKVCGGLKVNFHFSYKCGDWVLRNIKFTLIIPPSQCTVPLSSYPGRGGGVGYCRHGYVPTSGSGFNFCDPCPQAIFNCLWSFTPFPPIGCITRGITIAAGEPIPSEYFEFGKCTYDYVTGLGKKVNIPNTLISCALDIIPACSMSSAAMHSRRKRDVRNQIILNYALASKPFIFLLEWKLEFFGKQVWLPVDEVEWVAAAFIPTISDQSDDGQGISNEEFDQITSMTPPAGVTNQDVIDFLERWNNTVYDWVSGKKEPTEDTPNRMSYNKIKDYKEKIAASNQEAKTAGFESFVEQYNDRAQAINEVTNWEEEEGVCAVVRVRIEQELALTREGFIAKLEIDNGEVSPLRNIDVTIKIRNAENGQESTSLFSIGNATLGGAIQPDRSLAMQQKGDLNWLMIPYSEAAPNEDTYYDVGGILRYDVKGNRIPVPLLPARIKVKPDPLLLVHYFWEKFVISDDPFTTKVEGAVPFTLAVAVKNAGNGTAHNLRITSSQPEIIENEKGLLVNFKMIGASIGNMNVTPSLFVNFGDVIPNMTVVASWWMVSSLKGTFLNYSATFENENPLGDPKLSLLDELEIHELIHRIYIVDGEANDGIEDFLVNERIDYNIFPDTIFSSSTLNKYDVNILDISLLRTVTDGSTTTFTLEATPTATGFVYYRYNTSIPTEELVSINSREFLRQVQIEKQLPKENAWFTSMIGDRKSKMLIGHIFDFVQDDRDIYYYNVSYSNMSLDLTVTLRPTQPPLNITLLPLETTTSSATSASTEESSTIPESSTVMSTEQGSSTVTSTISESSPDSSAMADRSTSTSTITDSSQAFSTSLKTGQVISRVLTSATSDYDQTISAKPGETTIPPMLGGTTASSIIPESSSVIAENTNPGVSTIETGGLGSSIEPEITSPVSSGPEYSPTVPSMPDSTTTTPTTSVTPIQKVLTIAFMPVLVFLSALCVSCR